MRYFTRFRFYASTTDIRTPLDVKPENLLVDFDTGLNIDKAFEAVMRLEPNAGRDGHASPLWFPHDQFDGYRVILTDFGHGEPSLRLKLSYESNC